MGKYFSKKKMAPKWARILEDFPWATHVGADQGGVVRAFSREPVHYPFGFLLFEDMGKSEEIYYLSQGHTDWEKYLWEKPAQVEVEEFGFVLKDLKHLNVDGLLFDSGAVSISDGIKSEVEYIDDFIESLSPECWEAISRRVLNDKRMNAVEKQEPQESWEDIARRIGFEFSEPQIEIFHEPTAAEIAQDVGEKIAEVFKDLCTTLEGIGLRLEEIEETLRVS